MIRFYGLIAATLLASAAATADGEKPQLEVNGAAWLEFGQIAHAGDSAYLNYNGNWKQSAGALMEVRATFSHRLKGSAGFGAYLNIGTYGSGSKAMNQMINAIQPFLTNANLTLSLGGAASPAFQLTGGLFPFKYNPYTRNLGLYLLQGTVYPGFLYSGFESFPVIGLSTLAGFHAQGQLFGCWKNHLLLLSEIEHKPYFDMSLAYLTSVNVADVFDFGAGINFYRLISVNEDLTTPRYIIDSHKPFEKWGGDYVYIDTAGSAGDSSKWDTTAYTQRGIKVMARFSFDPKPLMGTDLFGENELVVYGEAGIIGLKNYPIVYEKIGERIPVMIGVNIPTFKFLDVLSLEMEYYGAKYRNDATSLEIYGSPIPGRSRANEKSDTSFDVSGDNFKWSVYAARTIHDCFRVSGQVANDHMRTSGNFWGTGGKEEALATPKDWYWMLKLSYFF